MYPRAFAEQIRRLFPKLIAHGEGRPDAGTKRIWANGPMAFEGQAWSDWPEASLISVARYLRGNKNLIVPPRWKAVFPTPFETLHKMEQQKMKQ